MVLEMDERMHEKSLKCMQIPNAKTRALEIENGSSSSIPMLVIETICFTQKNLSYSKLPEMDHFNHDSQNGLRKGKKIWGMGVNKG